MQMREQKENGSVNLSLLDTRGHAPFPRGDTLKKYSEKNFRQSLQIL